MGTVDSWGVGRPDFYKQAMSSRPTILSLQQTAWLQSNSYVVGAQSVEIDDIYTVPTGNVLELGGGQVSAKDSVINRLRLLSNNIELVGDYRYDMIGDISLSSMAGQTLSAGDTLTAYIYNNDTLSSNISLTLSGVLKRV